MKKKLGTPITIHKEILKHVVDLDVELGVSLGFTFAIYPLVSEVSIITFYTPKKMYF